MLDIDGLLGGLFEHEAGGRFHLDDFVPPSIQVVQVDDPVFVRVVEAVGELLIGAVLVLVLGHPDFKFSALNSVTDDRIHLIDGETGLLLILDGDLSGLAGPQIDLVGRGIQDVPGRGLFFRDDIVPFGEVLLRDRNLTVCVYREVPDLYPGLGLDLKDRAGQMLAVDVHLHDFQGGPLVVLELHLGLLVGEQRHRLRGSVQDVILRNTLLNYSEHPGQEVGDDHLPIRPGGLGGDGGAVRAPQREGNAGNGITGVLVPFADNQAGPLVVAQTQLGNLTGGQLHMVLGLVQDVIRQRGGFYHRINSRLQVLHENLTAVLGGAVDGVAGVPDGGDFEGNAVQRRPVRAGLYQPQAGLFCVGEHELRRVIGPEMDDALGVVNDIARTLQFNHFVGALGQLAQVDLAPAVCDELLGAVASIHSPNTEFYAGDGLGGVGAVHLHQLHAGQHIVEEKQLLDAAAGGQLDLLGSRILDMAVVPGVYLDRPIGAGFDAGQQDLTAAVRLIVAQGNAVAENLKGDAAHGLVALPVIFQDFQTDLRQIFEHQRASRNGIAVGVQLQLDLLHFGGRLVIGGRNQLCHGIFSGLDVLTSRLGGVPPLDALQHAGFIGVKLIDAVGDGGELKGGGADPSVGQRVPLKQERLSGLRDAAVLNAAGGANLGRACLSGVLRGLAGHGNGGGQRGTAGGSSGLLDIQRDAPAILDDVGDGCARRPVGAGGHHGQRGPGAGGVRIDGELRAGEGLLIFCRDFLQLQIDGLFLRDGRAIGECHLGRAAAADKLFGGHIGGAAGAANIGQLGGVILMHLKSEGGVRIKDNTDRFIGFQGKSQTIASVNHLIRTICVIFPCCIVGGTSRSIGYSEAPCLASGNRCPRLLGDFQGSPCGLRPLKVEGGQDVQAIGTPLGKDRIPDLGGLRDAVHKAVRLGIAVGGAQLLAGGSAVPVQGILQELALGLPHPLRHVADGGGLVPNQAALDGRFIVVERIGHHFPQGIGAANTVGVNEHAACLNDDPVLGPQVAAGVMDVLRPLGDGVILAPAGSAAVLTQPAQQVQESVIGLVDFI